MITTLVMSRSREACCIHVPHTCLGILQKLGGFFYTWQTRASGCRLAHGMVPKSIVLCMPSFSSPMREARWIPAMPKPASCGLADHTPWIFITSMPNRLVGDASRGFPSAWKADVGPLCVTAVRVVAKPKLGKFSTFSSGVVVKRYLHSEGCHHDLQAALPCAWGCRGAATAAGHTICSEITPPVSTTSSPGLLSRYHVIC